MKVLEIFLQDCKTKYQRKCQYKKQCHTSLQLSCKKPNRLRRPPVSSSYGAPLGPVKTFQISKASYGPPRVDRDVAAQQQPQQQLPQRQPQQPPQHQPQQPPQHQPQQPPQQPPLQPPKDEEEVLGEGDQGPFRPSVKFYQVPSAEDFQGEADGKKKPNSDSFRQATPFQRPPRFRYNSNNNQKLPPPLQSWIDKGRRRPRRRFPLQNWPGALVRSPRLGKRAPPSAAAKRQRCTSCVWPSLCTSFLHLHPLPACS